MFKNGKQAVWRVGIRPATPTEASRSRSQCFLVFVLWNCPTDDEARAGCLTLKALRRRATAGPWTAIIRTRGSNRRKSLRTNLSSRAWQISKRCRWQTRDRNRQHASLHKSVSLEKSLRSPRRRDQIERPGWMWILAYWQKSCHQQVHKCWSTFIGYRWP